MISMNDCLSNRFGQRIYFTDGTENCFSVVFLMIFFSKGNKEFT